MSLAQVFNLVRRYRLQPAAWSRYCATTPSPAPPVKEEQEKATFVRKYPIPKWHRFLMTALVFQNRNIPTEDLALRIAEKFPTIDDVFQIPARRELLESVEGLPPGLADVLCVSLSRRTTAQKVVRWYNELFQPTTPFKLPETLGGMDITKLQELRNSTSRSKFSASAGESVTRKGGAGADGDVASEQTTPSEDKAGKEVAVSISYIHRTNSWVVRTKVQGRLVAKHFPADKDLKDKDTLTKAKVKEWIQSEDFQNWMDSKRVR
eukprot:TRINITY_DN12222_c0_g1::TRINITY_DN12222_c0_g1_i1::g.12936::m.12936 TRINITY_DN12222_c0_g1::TRINITY_DN12222_c0_g1_i1::g.12936  ORF type:complete len:273 (-),score=23.77 TRINITY_DN12222_c0_g1_i1:351-1142(-)